MVYTDINTCTINGRLTKDAAFKSIKDDFGEVSFTVCTNTLTKKDGEWAAKPNFILVKNKGKNLDKFASSLTKGKQVSVTGAIMQDSWEKDGQKNSITYILAEKVQFMSNGSGKSDSQAGSYDDGFPEDNFNGSGVPF